jgi:predicted ATPase
LDILIALIEHPGQVLSKDALISRVWPNTIVEEANVKVHVSALRRAIGDGSGGKRYIVTVPGRGYSFVAPVTVEPIEAAPPQVSLAKRSHNLSTPPPRLIGRSDVVSDLVRNLPQLRILTIAGPGGIGKTSVALAIAEELIARSETEVWLVDLSPIGDGRLVPSALAAVLGLEIHSDTPLPGLVNALRERQMVIVLDNCEHLLDGAALLASALRQGTIGVHVVATSREPLRIQGEHVHHLRPLASPPPSADLTTAEARGFSAMELFVERATASSSEFEFNDGTAPIIANICHKLDGIPLAIEFAAARVGVLGVHGLASRLEDRLRLFGSSRRAVAARHRTMRATLDWSYDLLSEAEKRTLNRLAIFAGGFTLPAAGLALGDLDSKEEDVITHVLELVAKSLIAADVRGDESRYRLLDTTRAYARELLVKTGEFHLIARRHATFFRTLIEQAEAEWDTRPTAEWVSAYAPQIDDVRAALDWAFSPDGDTVLGIALTAAAVPLWFEMWLLEECRVRAERALKILEATAWKDDRRMVRLYAAVALSQAYTTDVARDTYAAWATALEIAESLDDPEYQLRALWGMWGTQVNRGHFNEGLALANRFLRLASTRANTNDKLIGDRLLGAVLHFLGDQRGARQHIERMLAMYVTPTRRSPAVRFQADQRVTASMYLARILWLQGGVDQALRLIEDTVAEAVQTRHPNALCNALAGAACPVTLWTGNLAAATGYVTMLFDHTVKDVLKIWRAHAACFEGELLVRHGDVTQGLPRLRAGVHQLLESGFGQYLPSALGALAEGLAADREFTQAQAVIDDAIARSEASGGQWCLAELLRIKGEIMMQSNALDAVSSARDLFLQSLDIARRQEALSWELRTAMSLAQQWHEQGRLLDAYEFLGEIYGRFKEGHETVDLRRARSFLDQLSTRLPYMPFRHELRDHTDKHGRIGEFG